MTKLVTSVAAMQLVEQGRITLDEPLGECLPELATIQVLEGFDTAGVPRFRPPRRPITLRHLLTHTAGFAYSIWNAELLQFQQYAGAPLGPLQAPLVFDPGERWSYGVNIDWVGRLVEQISHQSLEDYFREYILDPLGMSDTGFVLRPDQRTRLAGRHQRQSDGSLQALTVEIPERPTFYNGGGQFGNARVLRPETVAEMARNQIGELTVDIHRSVMPGLSNDLEFFPGQVKKWGLGGMINTGDAPTGRGAGSWAWAGLGNTYFWVDPTRHVTGLILTQILPFCDAAVLELFDQFERLIYAGRARQVRG